MRQVFDTRIRHADCEVHIYDSISSIIEESQEYIDQRVSYLGMDSFLGRKFNSLNHLLEEASSYWDDGMRTYSNMLSQLNNAKLPHPVSRKRRLRWDEYEGDEVDLDRMRAGQSFWRRSRRETTAGPTTITIVTDVGALGRVKHSDLLWRGAGAVVLTKLLEEAGYRVELWASNLGECVYEGRETSCLTAIRLKRPQDPLNEPVLVNAVSAWFFRTIIFGNRMNSKRETDFGAGSTTPTPDEAVGLITPDEKRVLISNVWSERAAVELIRSTIESLQPAERRR